MGTEVLAHAVSSDQGNRLPDVLKATFNRTLLIADVGKVVVPVVYRDQYLQSLKVKSKVGRT